MTVVLIKGDEGCTAFAIGGQIDLCCFILDLMGTRAMTVGLLKCDERYEVVLWESVCQISLELWA